MRRTCRSQSAGGVGMKKSSAIIILATALFFAVRISAQVTALTHATVIDGTGAGPQNDVTIVMENGHIRDIKPTSKISTPAGATVVDLSGKFILPGIINAHGHVDAKRDPQLRQYALYGVTTTTNMGFDPDDSGDLHAGEPRGSLAGQRR